MNHNNYFFLKHLTAQLGDILHGAFFAEAYSTGKNELFIQFKTTDGVYFQLKLNFIKTDTVLSFPDEIPLHPKNKLSQFKQLASSKIINISQHLYERSLAIEFDNDQLLYIKLFGKNGNVILFENGKNKEVFRSQIKADAEMEELPPAQQPIDIQQALIELSPAETAKRLPFLPADFIEILEEKGFYAANDKENLLAPLLIVLEHPVFYICKNNNSYQLLFFPKGEILGTYTEPVEAQNDFARLYRGSYFFEDKKLRIVQSLTQRKTKLEKEIASKKLKLEKTEQQVPYNQQADILMANLHTLQKGMEKAILHDFYRDAPIEIKLKKDLSPQQNAENYYRKSKNQVKETTLLQENLQKAAHELEQITRQLDTVLQAQDSKSLRGLEKDKQTSVEEDKPTLFKEFDLKGYKILVGKNSENNDLLTLKHTAKNDIWLHARGVSGSHVVIRKHGNNPVPADVLEYAASLAAFFSKLRNDSLCPVIYTEKKFVRKPKGAAPGQVTVEKESVLLVKPAFGTA